MIAKKIIKIAQSGVHDSAQISAQAIKELEIRARLIRKPPMLRSLTRKEPLETPLLNSINAEE
jgi:hypothetical protein